MSSPPLFIVEVDVSFEQNGTRWEAMLLKAKPERFFVVPAPGHYGDQAKVYSSHRTIAAARKAAGKSEVVRVGNKAKGDTWLRVYEETYPVAGGGL